MPFTEPSAYNPLFPAYTLPVLGQVGSGDIQFTIAITDTAIIENGNPVGNATEAQMDAFMQSLLDLFEGSALFNPYDIQKNWTVPWHQEGSPTL